MRNFKEMLSSVFNTNAKRIAVSVASLAVVGGGVVAGVAVSKSVAPKPSEDKVIEQTINSDTEKENGVYSISIEPDKNV